MLWLRLANCCCWPLHWHFQLRAFRTAPLRTTFGLIHIYNEANCLSIDMSIYYWRGICFELLHAHSCCTHSCRVLPHVDYVLLSHPDLPHIGALSYLVGQCGLKAPIFGTLPVLKMGQMFMYDAYLSRSTVGDFSVFNLDHVDEAFGRIHQLKFMQRHALSGEQLQQVSF